MEKRYKFLVNGTGNSYNILLHLHGIISTEYVANRKQLLRSCGFVISNNRNILQQEQCFCYILLH